MHSYKQEWYGAKAKVIRQYKDVQIIDYGCSGKGIITNISLFPGIQLSLLEMETDMIFPSNTFADDIISMNYCIEGRQESVFKDHTISYLPQNHLSVNGTKYLPVSFSFPLKRYKGISLVIEKNSLDMSTEQLLKTFGINLQHIEERLNLDSKWFICHQTKELDHLYGELLELIVFDDKSIDMDRLRIKVIELLLHIAKMDAVMDDEHIYFSSKQIRKTKMIAAEMLDDLESKKTIEEYGEEYEISPSVFHKVFHQIYDDTPYGYLKKYKMNVACIELRKGKKIGDIAIELGYNNPSKFSKAFKSVYGVLPKDYK